MLVLDKFLRNLHPFHCLSLIRLYTMRTQGGHHVATRMPVHGLSIELSYSTIYNKTILFKDVSLEGVRRPMHAG